jgi:hypothetical protein
MPRPELEFRTLEFAAAHETRHVWQKETDMTLFEDECRAECDAYPYGYEVLKRYLASRGHLNPEVEAEIDGKIEEKRSALTLRWPNCRFEAIDPRGKSLNTEDAQRGDPRSRVGIALAKVFKDVFADEASDETGSPDQTGSQCQRETVRQGF